ncbi:uncharacterized protein LOC100213200 isoform X1 [Hydra vulgaris]|uniref:uncharacterized protein LOC100213200 isoform X1 n=1 Tax=Hydra vulgaris TaxID=6087 RepID=UPI001F5F4509|nr:uncharacterized protein LOC100213200 [Hydra vulgaris]
MFSSLFNKLCDPYVSCVLAESEKKLIVPVELDIYYEPPETEEVLVGSQPSVLFDFISEMRKSVTSKCSGLLTTHEKIGSVISFTDAFLRDTYRNVLADPHILLKPSTIVLASVAGALAAGRGRRPIKRFFYSSLLGVSGSAVCYPEQAQNVAITAYYHSINSLANLNNLWQSKSEEKAVQLDTKDENYTNQVILVSEISSENLVSDSVILPNANEIVLSDETLNNTNDKKLAEDNDTEDKVTFIQFWTGIPDDSSMDNEESLISKEVPEVKKDFGQSDPEDQEMYSTRAPN